MRRLPNIDCWLLGHRQAGPDQTRTEQNGDLIRPTVVPLTFLYGGFREGQSKVNVAS